MPQPAQSLTIPRDTSVVDWSVVVDFSPHMEPMKAGRQRLARSALKRHRHAEAYAAVLLAGSYEEAGDSGRRLVGPGEVLLHYRFQGHCDRIGRNGAEILNLVLPPELPNLPFAAAVANPDELARIAERNGAEASRLLLTHLSEIASQQTDWPDLLANSLAAQAPVSICSWANEAGLHVASVARGFRRLYGVSPRRFRAEVRAARALRALLRDAAPLAAVASDFGFADQSHMTREIGRMTGRSPGSWRRA